MADPFALTALPADDDFCRAAQRVIVRTDVPVQVQLHADFDGFVKSKATIDDGVVTIHQYNWRDDAGRLLGISCKLTNTDHLVATFGPGCAGPEGTCQDMNRAVYGLVRAGITTPRYPRVVFDPHETVVNEKEPGMTGPDWLAPFALTSVDADGALRIHAKGFVVEFLDPRFAAMPERFRGVHYGHFIAPGYLRELLTGGAEPGAVIGKWVGPPR